MHESIENTRMLSSGWTRIQRYIRYIQSRFFHVFSRENEKLCKSISELPLPDPDTSREYDGYMYYTFSEGGAIEIFDQGDTLYLAHIDMQWKGIWWMLFVILRALELWKKYITLRAIPQKETVNHMRRKRVLERLYASFWFQVERREVENIAYMKLNLKDHAVISFLEEKIRIYHEDGKWDPRVLS